LWWPLCGQNYRPQNPQSRLLLADHFLRCTQNGQGLSAVSAIFREAKASSLPLQPVVVEAPFQQWGLDFIGQFKDNSSNGFTWIITTTDYFTKWVEAIPTKHAIDKVVMDFLADRIITRFVVPSKITTDNAKAFTSTDLSNFCFNYGIVLSHSSNYYPQGNGLAESNNKNLMNILKKTVGDNKRSWDNKITFALWADRITKRVPPVKAPSILSTVLMPPCQFILSFQCIILLKSMV
jgi:transposase InsO family protein